MLHEVTVVVDGVIYTALFPLKIRDDGVKAAVVAIPRRQEALRCLCVAPTAERCDERGAVAVRFTQRYAMTVLSFGMQLARWKGDSLAKVSR